MTTLTLPSKKKRISFLVLLFLIVAATVAFGANKFHQNKIQRYAYVLAEKGNMKETIRVTGRIKPVTEIGLAFEKSGKVARILVNVGDEAKQGQALIYLSSDEAAAQLDQAKAQLSFEQAQLQKLENGASPQQRAVARTKVANAQESLVAAEKQLQDIQEKAKTSLNKVCQMSVEDALKSLNVARNSLLTLTDLQYSYFNDSTQQSINLANKKEEAIGKLFSKKACGRCVDDVIASLSDGLENQFNVLRTNSSLTGVEVSPLLSELLSGLNDVKSALDMVQVSKLTSAESASLDSAKTNIYTEIISVTSNQQAINLQEKTNKNTLTTYRNKVETAENALALAKKELALTEAPPTQDEINVQRARIEQAQAQVAYYKAQLAKTALRSPLDGIVTAVNIKAGEIANPQQVVIKLISKDKFQIEADITETNIANVKVGQEAEITLDAYGDDVKFIAKVIEIDPAEKMIEGIATYKTTFQLLDEKPRLKPGMTANIDILVQKKDNALIIPQRAVIRKDGAEFVKVLTKGNDVKEVKITTGIRGDDGNVEVIKGLQEGDKVIAFTKMP